LASFPALDLTWRSGIEAAALDALQERLHSALDEFSPQAIHDHESADGWRVFFRSAQQRNQAADALQSLDDVTSVATIDIEDDQWARRSQANLTPIQVGRITVTPPWHVDDVSGHEWLKSAGGAHSDHPPPLVIVIDPSTGFGTGHHETTRLCLTLLQELDLAGRTAIDVGTGSGILAIAAARLGAAGVVAFDEDPEALRNARENVERNGVSGSVEVREADLASFSATPAPVVIANITASVLQRFVDRLSSLVEPGGVLIASGFSPAEADDVAGAFAMVVDREVTEGDWAALRLRSPA
jgi:ribosomal protein L11 methyltransferase